MSKTTKESLWTANSVHPTHKVRFMDMNNGHLANVYQLNLKRQEQGMEVLDIISVLSSIALERRLSIQWMTTYHHFDPDQPYLKHGEKPRNDNEKILVSKATVLDLMEVLNNSMDELKEEVGYDHEKWHSKEATKSTKTLAHMALGNQPSKHALHACCRHGDEPCGFSR